MEMFSNICLPKVFEQNFSSLKLSGAAPYIHGYVNNLFSEPSLSRSYHFWWVPRSQSSILCTLEFVCLFKECKLREQEVKGHG
jgi:hypothetical protein